MYIHIDELKTLINYIDFSYRFPTSQFSKNRLNLVAIVTLVQFDRNCIREVKLSELLKLTKTSLRYCLMTKQTKTQKKFTVYLLGHVAIWTVSLGENDHLASGDGLFDKLGNGSRHVGCYKGTFWTKHSHCLRVENSAAISLPRLGVLWKMWVCDVGLRGVGVRISLNT